MEELKACPQESATLENWTGKPEDYDYYPVGGEPKNGFYPVRKGNGTYCWDGEKIVPKEVKT